MVMDIARLNNRLEKAKALKQPFESQYKEALDFAAPTRQVFGSQTNGAVLNNSNNVFDSTATDALDHFVSNFQSSLFPIGQQWVGLESAEGVQNKDVQDRVLQTVVTILFNYLRRSNFDSQISESLADLGVGVGSILLNKGTKENPFIFKSVSISQLYMEEGPEGRPDTRYRVSQVERRHILELWPDAQLPKEWETDEAKDGADTKEEIVEAFLGNSNIEVMSVGKGGMEKGKGLRYVVFTKKGNHKLVEREQWRDPLIVFRWPTLPGEVWARGPLVKALPTVKTINKAKELLLKKASRDTYGIYTYMDDGIINIENIKLGPMCFIPVESNGGSRGASIAPLPSAGDVNLAQFIFTDEQNTINRMMFAEPLGRVDLPVKSATEVALRQQALAKRSGSAYGRIQHELIIPLVNGMLHILEELGLIDLSGNKAEDGRTIVVNYMSPLAKAQDAETLMAVQGYAQFMIGLFGPEMGMGLVDMEGVAKLVRKLSHAPMEVMPSPEQIGQMKQALLQRAIQQGAANQQAANSAMIPEAA
jgi:hypothetical protein